MVHWQKNIKRRFLLLCTVRERGDTITAGWDPSANDGKGARRETRLGDLADTPRAAAPVCFLARRTPSSLLRFAGTRLISILMRCVRRGMHSTYTYSTYTLSTQQFGRPFP